MAIPGARGFFRNHDYLTLPINRSRAGTGDHVGCSSGYPWAVAHGDRSHAQAHLTHDPGQRTHSPSCCIGIAAWDDPAGRTVITVRTRRATLAAGIRISNTIKVTVSNIGRLACPRGCAGGLAGCDSSATFDSGQSAGIVRVAACAQTNVRNGAATHDHHDNADDDRSGATKAGPWWQPTPAVLAGHGIRGGVRGRFNSDFRADALTLRQLAYTRRLASPVGVGMRFRRR